MDRSKQRINLLGRVLQWAWIISAGGILITPGGVHCTICDAIGLGDFGDTVINVLGIGLIAFGVRGLASSFLQARSQPVLNEQAINQQGL